MRKSIHTAILGLSLVSGAVLLSTPVLAASNTTTTTTATTAATTPATPMADKHGNPIILKLTEKLSLTQAQKDQIKGIVTAARPGMDKDMQALMANDRATRDAMNSDDYSTSQIKKLADQKGDLVSDMTVERANMHHQIMAVLTPTQKTELKQLIAQKRGEFQAKH
jgi:Spy/CpxP family protein refolding chaperone